METKIKNRNLQITVLQLNTMLNEKISLGTKNRIGKVVKLLMPHYEEFHKLHIEVLKKHGATDSEGQIKLEVITEEFTNEFKELIEQDNTITFDPIDFLRIENIESEKFYDMEMLKSFFENYS